MGGKRATANFAAAFILTVSLFALWGLGHRLYDTLLPQFAKVFDLRSFQLALTQSVYSIVYFVGAIPAALYARRFGYKAAILIGLGSVCVGAFVLYPAAETHVFDYFLGAIALMSLGWILLEVAANPLAACLGPEEHFVQRLNLAQSFFPLGALAGMFIGNWLLDYNLALPAERFAHSIVHPYIVIGVAVLVLAYLFDDTRFPAIATEQTRGFKAVGGEFRTLLTSPLFLFGIVAQFFSVMALAGTWSQTGRHPELSFLGNAFVASMAVFALGRFAGSALMVRIKPALLLALFCFGGIVLCLVAVCFGGLAGGLAMVATSFFLSITWPTVLGLSIQPLGKLMKLGTALICMGSALGGFAYPMVTVVWHISSTQLAMLVPAASFAVVLAFAIVNARVMKQSAGASGNVDQTATAG
jgi:FHS family L-fucose permease-like MFS transporter